MESTGIYWINLHYVLRQAGINVCLYNWESTTQLCNDHTIAPEK